MDEIEEVEFKMLTLYDWHRVNEAIDDLLNAGFSFQRLHTVNMDVHGGSGSVYDFSPQLRRLKNKYPSIKMQFNSLDLMTCSHRTH